MVVVADVVLSHMAQFQVTGLDVGGGGELLLGVHEGGDAHQVAVGHEVQEHGLGRFFCLKMEEREPPGKKR